MKIERRTPQEPTLVNVTTSADLSVLVPEDSDLAQQIGTATVTLEWSDAAPIAGNVPSERDEIAIYADDDVTLMFGGYVAIATELSRPGLRRAVRLDCQDWNVRMFEEPTGSHDKSAVTDTDRNFVIALFKEALMNQTFNGGTGITDPIITANEAIGWSGVQATAVIVGLDWSYTLLSNAIDRLRDIVPNVWLRIRPDKIVEYGDLRVAAPFALHTTPDNVLTFAYSGYHEQWRIAGHFNKARRGGESTSEETFFDEVSYAELGRIIESPYRDDPEVLSTDLRRRTYAEGARARRRLTADLITEKSGLRAGMEVDVVHEVRGSSGMNAPMLTLGPWDALIGTSIYGGDLAGERGRFLVQKVTTKPLGNNRFEYAVQLGDNLRDLPTALAVLSGGT